MSALSELLIDIRYAIRAWRKTPTATAIAMFALALGIGVNSLSFISANSIILHPFPFPRLERITVVSERSLRSSDERTALSPANYEDVVRQNRSFEAIAGYRLNQVNLTNSPDPEQIQSYSVQPAFFSILGMRAKLGRRLSSGDEQPGRANVAVVSFAFWKSHLAGSRGAIGSTISLDRQRITVVGVMPDEFDFPLGTQIWVPWNMSQSAFSERVVHDVSVLGLLKPDVPVGRAGAELDGVARRLASAYPLTNRDHSFAVEPIRSLVDHETDRFIAMILGSAGFVLLLACANIGNLQLARAATRQKEIAVRAALGASRFQIARQLMTETVLLALAAAPVGLLLASWNNDRMKSAIPPLAFRAVPGLRTMHVDATVVCFTVIFSVAAGIVCSLPAIVQLIRRRTGADLTDVLRDRSGPSDARLARHSLRAALVVSELALALVLLVSAGLMVNTFHRLANLNQGFDPRNVLRMQVSLPESTYPTLARTKFYDTVLEGFGSLPGVKAEGLSSAMGQVEHLLIEGRPEPGPGEPLPYLTSASGGYLAAMKIPQLSGRFIAPQDRSGARHVVVLSESVVRHYWPAGDAIGHRIKFRGGSEWLTVVGVCGDLVDDWLTGQPTLAAYVSYAQYPGTLASFELRTAGDPMQLASAARAAVRRSDSRVAVYELSSMEQYQADQRSGIHAAASTMTTYSAIALLLAVTGVYAVLSYFVAARTHDIGVHMALGATRTAILSMTLRQAGWLILAGLAIGMPLAFASARVMSGALYGIVSIDGKDFALYTVVLGASALLASYLPSLRATRVDPLVALRQD